MAPKRALESDSTAGPAAKKHRKGFRVGPQNLPDGPWKRKVDKIKKDLIHKAKVKKAYKKIKASEEVASKLSTAATEEDVDEPQFHPERQAMLDQDEQPELSSPPPSGDRPRRRRKQNPRKPGYFDKAVADAEHNKAETEARAQEIERRNQERNRKLAEREKFRRAMVKARTPGRDGKRRLGRESGLLLEKAKKIAMGGK
ncbi:hypothetical protein F5B20DRAFT_166859 [Whalleya microplaca]|nr:hypothetical protein F5B20DRAFT_166859 [Whalleya microplaca]